MACILRRLLLFSILLALAGCIAAPQTAPDAQAEHRAEGWIVTAQRALANGHIDEAAQDYYRAAVQSTQPEVALQATTLAWRAQQPSLTRKAAQRWHTLQPKAPGPHHFLAVLALQRNDLDTATAQLRAFIHALPGQNDFKAAADTLTVSGSAYQALVVMRRLQAAHPASAAAQFALARLASAAEHTRLARRKVEAALAIKPDYEKALVLRARLLIQADKPKQALAPFRQRLASPDAPSTLSVHYGELLFMAGQADAARKRLVSLVGDKPLEQPKALLLLALDRLDSGQLERARRYLTLLLESGRYRAQAYYYLAALAAREKNYKLGLDFLRRIDDKRRTAADDLAVASILARMGQATAAQHFLSVARRRKPHSAARLSIGEARLLSQRGQPAAAFRVLDSALKPRPDNTDLLYARSMLAERMGRQRQALADVQRVVRLEPGNTMALNALGYMLTEHTTRYHEAQRYIKKALHYAPNNPAIIDSLGWVEFRRGNMGAALKALTRAYHLTNDAAISAHYVAVLKAAGRQTQAQTVLDHSLKLHPNATSLLRLKGK